MSRGYPAGKCILPLGHRAQAVRSTNMPQPFGEVVEAFATWHAEATGPFDELVPGAPPVPLPSRAVGNMPRSDPRAADEDVQGEEEESEADLGVLLGRFLVR